MEQKIGTLNEQALHSALKEVYAGGVGRVEVLIDGYIIDVVQGDLLIEIQTQNFYAIKKKIFQLIPNHAIKLVYPIASEKWLIKLKEDCNNDFLRRKSPKRGRPLQVFNELISFPELMGHQNFGMDIVMADVEELRRYSGKKSWRQNGWQTIEQRLVRVVNTITLQKPADLLMLIPGRLPDKFTSADLQKLAKMPLRLAQKAVFCLRKAGAIKQSGKHGRYVLYELADDLKQPT